jgi:hypothetical protein
MMSSAERGPIPIAMVKMPTSVPTSAKALRRQRSDTRRSRPNPRQRCTGKQRECDHALGIPSFSMFVAASSRPAWIAAATMNVLASMIMKRRSVLAIGHPPTSTLCRRSSSACAGGST